MGDKPSIVMEMRLWEEKQFNQNKECTDSKGEIPSTYNLPTPDLQTTEYESVSKIQHTEVTEDFYHTVVDNPIEGILIIDFNGTILYANQAIMNMMGSSNSKEIIGKKAIEFVDERYHKRVIKDQLLVKRGKGGFLDSYQIKTFRGNKLWVEGIGCIINYDGKESTIIFLRNITDRRKTWDSLIKLEKKYRAIAEMSADGILTLDTMGKLRYVNPSFQNITKCKEPILIGKIFRELLSDESIYQFQQLILDVRKKNGAIKHLELELINGENQVVPIELSMSPLYSEGLLQGFVCTIHDISDRKRMEEEMRKSEQLKTEFMNIAAHELKSPVTPIKGYLDLIISDDETDDKIKQWAKVSLRNAERLLLLVNDILDVSRLDNDTMSFEMKKMDSSELVNTIIEDMSPCIQQKNLTFNVLVPENLPEIFGDYHRLEQVLKNLFTNALKFTDEGSISFEAVVESDKLIIFVSDTGIGIDPDELDLIFEKFYQADTAESRKHEGTGLGLFICNEIIHKHKGTITVESIAGKGSTFTITLPVLKHNETGDDCIQQEATHKTY